MMRLVYRRTSSPAKLGSRSYSPSAQANSIATLWPSTKPDSFKPRRKPAVWGAACFSERALRYPITGIVACCPRAPSGHAAAAPPMSVMNSRRFNFITSPARPTASSATP